MGRRSAKVGFDCSGTTFLFILYKNLPLARFLTHDKFIFDSSSISKPKRYSWLRYGPRRTAMVRINKVISAHSDLSLCVQRCLWYSGGSFLDLIAPSDSRACGLDYRPVCAKLELEWRD